MDNHIFDDIEDILKKALGDLQDIESKIKSIAAQSKVAERHAERIRADAQIIIQTFEEIDLRKSQT